MELVNAPACAPSRSASCCFFERRVARDAAAAAAAARPRAAVALHDGEVHRHQVRGGRGGRLRDQAAATASGRSSAAAVPATSRRQLAVGPVSAIDPGTPAAASIAPRVTALAAAQGLERIRERRRIRSASRSTPRSRGAAWAASLARAALARDMASTPARPSPARRGGAAAAGARGSPAPAAGRATPAATATASSAAAALASGGDRRQERLPRQRAQLGVLAHGPSRCAACRAAARSRRSTRPAPASAPAARRRRLDPAVGDHVEPVAGLALADHVLAGTSTERLERPRKPLDLGRPERRKDRHAAQQRDLLRRRAPRRRCAAARATSARRGPAARGPSRRPQPPARARRSAPARAAPRARSTRGSSTRARRTPAPQPPPAPSAAAA